jgi:hypothetical protein
MLAAFKPMLEELEEVDMTPEQMAEVLGAKHAVRLLLGRSTGYQAAG